ncbi:uncharacterized protein [Drosophila pseudoobscura]|uniref:Uncharacterized protein isoform X1 n=2 Tax=Drosophila pseudoobscura pseudoobscura TaxID=46245 RepID=Q29GI7_DROPS|nr:uncharacterized protein LOC4815265 isoform X1 [Drosophila pseudoobscura]
MASNSPSKKKSSGMRVLWIPGRKSHHPKGRYSTTSKHVSYSGPQKKSEVWSLGGSKAQTELIDFPMSEGLATPSSSLSIVATCSLVQSVKLDHHTSSDDLVGLSETATLPASPGAEDTPPHSPLSEAPSTPSTKAMTSPNVITTAEVQNLHNFLCPEELPKVPGHLAATAEAELALNSSAGTTASIATTSSPLVNRKAEPQQMPAITSHSQQASPQKTKYKNHNNNQEDINSIESLSSFPRFQGNAADFDWIDEMVQQRNCNELMHKNKRKKGSKKAIESLEKDQLDGKSYDYKTKDNIDNNDGDEKMVTCLYYSLMCCDCTIS